MSDMESMLDVYAPPPGQRFVRGIILTHDLSISALNELLLPVLAGVGTTGRQAGCDAAIRLPPKGLTVVAAGDRFTADSFRTPATRILWLKGRRLHAKVAVLQFERDNEDVSTATGGFLTIVTSANLTDAGLCGNWEIYATEWLPSNGGGGSIAQPVLDAMKRLADDPSLANDRLELRRLVRGMTKELPAKARPARAAIADSLNSPTGKPFVTQLLHPGPTRLTLVGPAFAANNADVASRLQSVLGSDPAVDLVVGSTLTAKQLRAGQGVVGVPRRLLSDLREQVGASNVTVYAVPIDDAATGKIRQLHGKSIIADYANESIQMLGSANITVRGLAGRNRELVLAATVPPETSTELLAHVGAVPLRDHQVVDVDDPSPLSGTVAPGSTPLTATLEPDPGQDAGRSMVTGTLCFVGLKNGTLRLPNGETVPVKNGKARVTLDGRHPCLSIDWGGHVRPLLISIDSSNGTAFWDVPLDIEREKVDPLLRMLLADIGTAARPTKAATGQSTSAGPAKTNDGFHIPEPLRLNALARYRNSLTHWHPERVDEALDSFFPDGAGGETAERDVGTAIADAATGRSSDTADELLVALREYLNESRGSALDV